MWHWKRTIFFRSITLFVLTAFIAVVPVPSGYAQLALPAPGKMIEPSRTFAPALMRGLKVNIKAPFHFSFIVDKGDEPNPSSAAYQTLIKYFLASLTIANKDMWVNLSPFESDRIIPDNFAKTAMGRDLLSQDYLLKQFTASLMYPEKGTGKTFWTRIYSLAYEKFGTTDIPLNTFNKVWIMADKADIYQKDDTAFLVDSHLKVMLEEDLMALEQDSAQFGINRITAPSDESRQIAVAMVREILIPVIEKEVNEGATFAQVRQIYSSMILATWFKKTLRDTMLAQAYADKNKTAGIALDDPMAKSRIYQQYIDAYKTGVFNFIKEETDPATLETLPRKYFAGGMTAPDAAMIKTIDFAEARKKAFVSGIAANADQRLAVLETILQPASAEEPAANDLDAAEKERNKPKQELKTALYQAFNIDAKENIFIENADALFNSENQYIIGSFPIPEQDPSSGQYQTLGRNIACGLGKGVLHLSILIKKDPDNGNVLDILLIGSDATGHEVSQSRLNWKTRTTTRIPGITESRLLAAYDPAIKEDVLIEDANDYFRPAHKDIKQSLPIPIWNPLTENYAALGKTIYSGLGQRTERLSILIKKDPASGEVLEIILIGLDQANNEIAMSRLDWVTQKASTISKSPQGIEARIYQAFDPTVKEDVLIEDADSYLSPYRQKIQMTFPVPLPGKLHGSYATLGNPTNSGLGQKTKHLSVLIKKDRAKGTVKEIIFIGRDDAGNETARSSLDWVEKKIALISKTQEGVKAEIYQAFDPTTKNDVLINNADVYLNNVYAIIQHSFPIPLRGSFPGNYQTLGHSISNGLGREAQHLSILIKKDRKNGNVLKIIFIGLDNDGKEVARSRLNWLTKKISTISKTRSGVEAEIYKAYDFGTKEDVLIQDADEYFNSDHTTVQRTLPIPLPGKLSNDYKTLNATIGSGLGRASKHFSILIKKDPLTRKVIEIIFIGKNNEGLEVARSRLDWQLQKTSTISKSRQGIAATICRAYDPDVKEDTLIENADEYLNDEYQYIKGSLPIPVLDPLTGRYMSLGNITASGLGQKAKRLSILVNKDRTNGKILDIILIGLDNEGRETSQSRLDWINKRSTMLSKVHQGTEGEIYRAFDPQTKHDVLIKDADRYFNTQHQTTRKSLPIPLPGKLLGSYQTLGQQIAMRLNQSAKHFSILIKKDDQGRVAEYVIIGLDDNGNEIGRNTLDWVNKEWFKISMDTLIPLLGKNLPREDFIAAALNLGITQDQLIFFQQHLSFDNDTGLCTFYRQAVDVSTTGKEDRTLTLKENEFKSAFLNRIKTNHAALYERFAPHFETAIETLLLLRINSLRKLRELNVLSANAVDGLAMLDIDKLMPAKRISGGMAERLASTFAGLEKFDTLHKGFMLASLTTHLFPAKYMDILQITYNLFDPLLLQALQSTDPEGWILNLVATQNKKGTLDPKDIRILQDQPRPTDEELAVKYSNFTAKINAMRTVLEKLLQHYTRIIDRSKQEMKALDSLDAPERAKERKRNEFIEKISKDRFSVDMLNVKLDALKHLINGDGESKKTFSILLIPF